MPVDSVLNPFDPMMIKRKLNSDKYGEVLATYCQLDNNWYFHRGCTIDCRLGAGSISTPFQSCERVSDGALLQSYHHEMKRLHEESKG